MACSCICASYKVTHTGDMVVRINRTHQGWTLGFASPLEYQLGNYLTWVLVAMLLHTCHLSWVAQTGDIVVCSCIHVTRCGLHLLES